MQISIAELGVSFIPLTACFPFDALFAGIAAPHQTHSLPSRTARSSRIKRGCCSHSSRPRVCPSAAHLLGVVPRKNVAEVGCKHDESRVGGRREVATGMEVGVENGEHRQYLRVSDRKVEF
ncbi:hypothetical protein OE88DRAFT_1665597 [Heliocybe sulcata]|uniref:Uncharacterized protein n=1 Tax=Heliocybe sulcata TaxID=5364 RepID=A0A5C3MVW8_9AGAM|nr:hypothetical protein OE88DRAFT_1665597 [Heliocybe sulcata]